MTRMLLFFIAMMNVSHASPDVIYGEDNRVDVYQSQNALLKKIAYSTAAMISRDFLVSRGDHIDIKAPLFKDVYRLCAKERFRDQLTAANCSGTLIDKDIILTAGHCYSTQGLDCKGYSWVFDYHATSEKQAMVTVPSSSVYHCKEIIALKDDQHSNIDYALIRLDRKVTDRPSIAMKLGGDISLTDKLAVIGHPRGLPAKIAGGGKVLEVSANYFRSSLDAYTVNSGSGVFNERTGEIEGVLISGTTDFETDASGCIKSRVLKESEGAEITTKIKAIWELVDRF